MTNNGLSALYNALTQEPGPHLADEVLAKLVTAETAGEDIDSLYPAEIRHIETCVECAESYSELIEMMLEAIEPPLVMDAANSREIYAALLEREVSGLISISSQISTLIQDAVAKLPVYFAKLPGSASEITPQMIPDILADNRQTAPEISQFRNAILEGIRRSFSAIPMYLTGIAEAAW